MCGISGIVNKNNKPVNREEIKKMNDIIIHRGPDGEGYYYGNNFAFGHRRLSVLDISQDGKQPMDFQDKYIIVFNGEIYNYKTIKEELPYSDYKSQTDTEVILAAYDTWGFDCVNHFNGMWAFAIYDKEKNIIFCSRDRFGIKPFYYAHLNDKFVFCSEIKQFTAFEDWKAKANKNRVMDFLMFEMFDHTDETLFDGVNQLRGGHNLIYDLNNHKYKINRYYSFEDKIVHNNIEFDEASKKFYDIFEDAVRVHLQSDVKIGSCLSGGLDSSSIVCVANSILKEKHMDFKQETVSSCFHNKQYDEQEYIDEVIKSVDILSHKVYPEFEDLFESLDKITWFQDEPFGSTSIFAQWNVFKTAKSKDIVVMLDGQGADELLAGYEGFYEIYFNELIKNFKWFLLIKEIRSLKKLYSYNTLKILKMTGKYMISNSIKSFIKTKIGFGITKWVKIDNKYYKEYLDNLYGSKIKTLKQYSLNQIFYSSLPRLLRYEDRDSMAHSIESRVPFLDYRLFELILSIPSKYKIKNGIRKYLMRSSLSGILPEKITNRIDKMGFVTPEEVWIRNNSVIFKKELINACNLLQNIIDKDKVLLWYDNIIESNKKIDFTVWRLISLGRWVKIFNVEI